MIRRPWGTYEVLLDEPELDSVLEGFLNSNFKKKYSQK